LSFSCTHFAHKVCAEICALNRRNSSG
jgi:hypothetical protein